MTIHKNTIQKYINKRVKSKNSGWYTIIDYKSAYNVTIKFDDNTLKYNVHAKHAINGNVKNDNNKFFNVGFIGNGKYSKKSHFKFYYVWYVMLQRCYDINFKKNNSSYEKCLVDPIWHNFQIFCLWLENNYIENYCLDKDILFKGNKIYSPDVCCFVPHEINMLFCKSDTIRGEYPIGVCFNKEAKKIQSNIKIYGKLKYLGLFDTAEEAFQAYKIAKEAYIKEVADKWKDKITDKVYQAMYNYQVEITD